MTITAEKKLQRLEDELKGLKATYMISGGNMKIYFPYSDVYTIVDVFDENPFRVKFTSSFGGSKDILIASFIVEQTTTGGDNINLSQYAITQEQTGNGTVTFEIPLLWRVSTIRVGIVGTVPGTFTRLQ